MALQREKEPQEAEQRQVEGNSGPRSQEHQNMDGPTPLNDIIGDTESGLSVRSSMSHWDPHAGFAHVDGDISGPGYNETTVDIIAVPCIGASPVETWTRDPLPDDYFPLPSQVDLRSNPSVKELAGSSILSPAINRHLPHAKHVWVRQGIKREVNTARVMFYRHRELTEGLTLDKMADDLLEHICRIREGQTNSRPMFFICHSIGGLVAKLALVKASKREDLRWIVFDTHGMTFFATPHRGSSYMSMPKLRESIRQILDLSRPMPRSITDELHLNHRSLLDMHEVFTDIASEMKIWTFCETADSTLSGFGGSDFDEVHFSAPLASIKSSILNSRNEKVFSIESDHAHCASFGPNNIQIMHSYLADLSRAVRKAEGLCGKFMHTPLRLGDNVRMEIIGFYDDPDPNSSIRLYVSKIYVNEFLNKGPENCLQERLNIVAPKPRRGRTMSPSRRLVVSSSSGVRALSSGALGILRDVHGFGQKLFGASDSESQPESPELAEGSPEIVVTSHARPSMGDVTTQAMLAFMPQRSRGLTVPSTSTPGFDSPSSRGRTDGYEAGRTLSDPTGAEISLRSARPESLDSSTAEKHAPETDNPDFEPRTNSFGWQYQDLTAGFSRPDPARRKFMWIHLPFNNPHWVKSILDKLSETQPWSFSKLLRNNLWVDRHIQGRHMQTHGSYVKSGAGFVPAETHSSPRPSSPMTNSRSPSPGLAPTHLYLYLPYLHFDTYTNLIRRRNIIKRRMAHGRARPVPRAVADLESLELRVIWEYIGHDPPLNTRKTLDQYGYPSLHDTYSRDDDQMLYKLTKERVTMACKKHEMEEKSHSSSPWTASPASRLQSLADNLLNADILHRSDDESDAEIEEDILNGNVLMVDQLWLWAVDAKMLATFFPKRESHATEGPMFQQGDLRNSVYNELNGDLTGRCENAWDLAAFITLHAVTVLLDRTSHADLEIFRIFEEAIGILNERMTSSLKRFRMQTYRDRMIDDSEDSDMEENSAKSIKKRHKHELEQAERENREHTSAVLELRDMDDELNTMRNLFSEQQYVVGQMKTLYDKPELHDHTHNGRTYLDEALRRLDEYKRQTTDMMERIETTRKDYEKLLEMVQRQAQVDEVRWSRLQTELASTQNMSVMIFTIFTVIFLPLSFFTSLFGMNTLEWTEDVPDLKTIGAISLPSSVFLIVASLIAAFSSRVQGVFKTIYRLLRKGVERTHQGVSSILPRQHKDAKERRRKLRADREKIRTRQRERGYDFWETVRWERKLRKQSDYQIPDLNRRSASKRQMENWASAWKSSDSRIVS